MNGQELAAIIGERVGPRLASLLHEPGFVDDLARGIDDIRARWPSQLVRLGEFGGYLAARLLVQKDVPQALGRLQVADLFLAFWAGTGDAAGIAAFEEYFAGDLDKLTRRFRTIPEPELRQRLRIKLFVADGDRAARISDYSGFGFLQNWLRVTAVRTFIDVARSEKSQRLEEVLDQEHFFAAGDPALGHVRAEVSAALKAAFAEAAAELPPRARNFLRHAHVDQLTLDQIAQLYRIHRATVARTLARARADLMETCRSKLVARLGIVPDELDSAIGYLDSQFELSLSRVLRDVPPES